VIPIQATIISFLNKPSTVFAIYDALTKILVISVEASYRRNRHENCIVITNDTSIDRDILFDTEKMSQAVPAFYALKGGIATDSVSSRLVFSEKAMRANPNDSVEKDGLDQNGQNYRLSPDITNAKVAALAACWYAYSKASLPIEAEIMRQNISESLRQGYIITI
jgi:hypothetical protein